jgi:hypothetical protein
MRRICVFCGSSPGNHPEFRRAAEELGRALAGRRLGLVYGGGRVGLMGAVADAALAAGAEVMGVIPKGIFDLEVGHTGLGELRVVNSMHERKALMASLSDGFIALPGGLGTLEELFEVWTWALLGLHRKPFGLLDVEGFFGPLVDLVDHQVAAGFVQREHRAMLHVAAEPGKLLDRLAAYRPPEVRKWITEEEI